MKPHEVVVTCFQNSRNGNQPEVFLPEVYLSVTQRGAQQRGRKQMRANANKRRQPLTNASKCRGENASKRKQTRANMDKRKQTLTPLYSSLLGLLTPPFAIPLLFAPPLGHGRPCVRVMDVRAQSFVFPRIRGAARNF